MKIKKVKRNSLWLGIGFSVLFAVGLLSGCVRNTIDDSLPAEIEGLTVPATFSWATMRPVQLTIAPNDTYNGAYYYYLEVFDDDDDRIHGEVSLILLWSLHKHFQWYHQYLLLLDDTNRVV